MALDITVSGISADNSTVDLGKPLDLRLVSSLDFPCESIDASFMAQNTRYDIKEITVSFNGNVRYVGIVDECEYIYNSHNVILNLKTRSKTAWLLDNEVLSGYYYNYTPTQIYNEFLAPFGVTSHCFTDDTPLDFMLIQKGYNAWALAELYCRYKFGKQPYIKNNGIVFDKYTSNVLTFSNEDSSHIPFSYAKLRYNRYNMISKLNIYSYEGEYHPVYEKHVENLQATYYGVKRERFYRIPEEHRRDGENAAIKVVASKDKDALAVELTVPFYQEAQLGDLAIFCENNNIMLDLYVNQIELIADSQGIKTNFILYSSDNSLD